MKRWFSLVLFVGIVHVGQSGVVQPQLNPAGVTFTYSGAPAAPAPVAYAQPAPVAYAQPAPVAQVAYAQPAPVPVAHAQPAPVVQYFNQPHPYVQYHTQVAPAPRPVLAPAIQYQQFKAVAPPPIYAQAAPVFRFPPQPVAFAKAPVIKAVAPALAVAPVKAVIPAEPFDPNPQYSYTYSVADTLTGDSKTASETRDGGFVKGQYSLVEPDGAIRTVTYTADPVNGFNAVVDRQAPAVPIKAIAAAPVIKAVAPALAPRPVAFLQPQPQVVKAVAPIPAPAPAPVALVQQQQFVPQPAYQQFVNYAPQYAAPPQYFQRPVVQAVAPRPAPFHGPAPLAYPVGAASAAIVKTTFAAPKFTYSY